MWVLIGIGAAGLALALVCAVMATALKSVHRFRDTEGLKSGKARQFLRYLDDADALHLTALIGKATGEALFFSCVAWWFFAGIVKPTLPQLSEVDRWLVGPLLSIASLALCAELLPPTLARNSGRRFLLLFLPLLSIVRRLVSPFIRALIIVKDLILRMLNVKEASAKSREIAEEILEVVSDVERDEELAPSEKDMIESIVELRAQEVSAIMTPRTEIHGITDDATLADVMAHVKEFGHSRIPVYEESIDKIVGLFYVKDVVALLNGESHKLKEIPVRSKLRKPYYIPETKRVAALLEEFRREKIHMAVILDEYGGTAGIVTIEDVLEEIVGEIADEYDENEIVREVALREDGSAEVDAMVSVEEINETLGLDLPEGEDFETVGGFVFSSMGKVPVIGDVFSHDGTTFEILEADARRIRKLKVTPASTNPTAP